MRVVIRFFAALLLALGAFNARGEAMLELFQVRWSDLNNKMPEIAEAGYTSLWLPPPAKASSVFSVGYDLYDPFDLGDKNQRGTVATKYGTRDELIKMVETAHRFGIRVYFDNIMNHRGFDVPGYNSSTPTNIYPGLIPKDFHLQTISGGFYRNWPNVQDWGNQWDVQYEPLSGLLDLANEPGTINGNFGNTLGSTTAKPTFIRQPGHPEYYLDSTTPNIGGGWHGFNGSNGVPVSEYVQDYEIRAAMWLLYVTKCDGFRLDAVKHVPSGFFGNSGNVWAGYTGGIQAMYDWVHGFGTNFNSSYVETDDCRNSCFDSEAPRNDALLFGEHLGEPPSYGEYISSGMRLLNTPMRSAIDSWAGGGSGSGLDQLNVGSPEIQANQGVVFAQDQDSSLCCVNNRPLHNAYYFMHEGIPMIYSDGNNWAGNPSNSGTFPIVPFANYLGQYGDNQMPDVAYLHHQLARGGTRPRWSDANIVAWERYDYRDVSGDAFNDPNATVVFFAANNKTGFPGDVNFDDGISRTSDGYYTCTPNGNPSRGYAMKVGFPPGSVLAQLASSTPGYDRTCPKLLVHNATTNSSVALSTANDPNPVNRALLVNSTPPNGGGAIELKIPSGGWVMYGYQWPEPSRANVLTNAITFTQGGARVPTISVLRKDGSNGDPNFLPLYPFKMRGSVDPNGNVITTGGSNVSNLTYSIDIPILTNAPFDIAVRCDASAVSVQSKLDGGVDLNSQMSIGLTSGLERRDNRPGSANGTDVFVGYETNAFQFRNGPEKFAAKVISRDNVTSLGAETFYYTTGGSLSITNGDGNAADVTTATPDWVYHDPAAPATPVGGGPATQMNPTNPAPGQAVDIWVKAAANAQSDHCHIYYTTDGSNPEGAFGAGKGTTRTIVANWVNHDASDATADWFKGTIPGQINGVQVRYKAALYQDNIGTISDSDNSKLYGLSQFGVTNFNPTTATVWTHNDRNTNNTQTGLSTGFHILRARTFLPRSGKSGVYNTFIQTFYYDGQLPGGVIATPSADGTSVSNGTYTIVVRADSATTGVTFNIQDSDANNDDVATGLNNGNGLTNGVPKFVTATNVPPDPALSALYPNYPQEFRFTYTAVPSNGVATVSVRFNGFATGAFPNRFGTGTRAINTIAPAQVLHVANPSTDGAILIENTNDVYTIQACFTSTLTTNNYNLFSIYINGVFQARQAPDTTPLYHLFPIGCGAGLRSLTYDWVNPMPGSNVITVLFTNSLFLSETKTIAVVRPGDSDGDGMSDYEELIAGTNPLDANSALRITGFDTDSQLLVWDSVSNVNYQVLSTTNLNVPFQPLSPIIPSAGASTFYLDTSPDPTNKFYRIKVVP